MINILIVDDEPEMLESLEKILSHRNSYSITVSKSGTEAISKLKESKFDLLITDLKLGKYSGIDILKESLAQNSKTPVIMISGYGTIESSVEAIKAGAFDFIEKPFTSSKLFETIDRALLKKKDKPERDSGTDENEEKVFENIIYNSKQMQNVVEMVSRIAEQKLNVLISGESGTGKELVARAIHNLCYGKGHPFVPVNCGALPESLFESELFGHEKGAFTGATRTKPGLLEFAKDGTFFFDEIGDMSLSMQVKLLRVIEEKKVRRIGAQKELSVDVRIVAATNKNLKAAVDDGSFREDLYFRLNTCPIEIPPLRERKADIIPLIEHYLRKLNEKDKNNEKSFSNDVREAVINYEWPGNVRELQNFVQKIFYLIPSKLITMDDLPIPIKKNDFCVTDDLVEQGYKDAKDKVIEQFEIKYLTHHLKRNKGNITKTAQECGMDRRSIHRLISRYNIIYKE